MTETEVQLGQLQENIAHLREISEDGWVLAWDEAGSKPFELVCKKANAVQVQKIDALISAAMPRAIAQLG